MMNEACKKAIAKNFGFELRVGDDIQRIVVPERSEELTRIFTRVLAGERCQVESEFKLPTGKLVYQDEAYKPVLDAAGRVTGISIFIHDVTGRRHVEQTIQAIVKGTSAAVGEPFFRALVTEVAAALGTRYALVGELLPGPGERIRTVAVSGDGAILENFAYDLANTPCSGVIAGGTQFHPRDLLSRFPGNAMIADLGLESYLGVRLFAASGKPLGLLSVLDDRPMKHSEFARRLLSIFAGRAGAELERLQVEAEKQRTLAILEEADDLIGSSDLQGNVLYMNAAVRRFFQITDSAGAGVRKVADFHPAWAAKIIAAEGVPTAQERGSWMGETAILGPDGREIPVSQIIIAHRAPSGEVAYLSTIMRDLSERKHAEEELKLAAEVFVSSGEAIVITDANKRILKVNPAFTATTGYLPEEVAGRTPYALSPGVRSPERDREIWTQAQQVGLWQGEVWDRRKSGETYPKWLTISVVRDAAGKPTNFIEIFSDVTERKEREERVRHLAHHDALTDLPNRVLLNDRIAQAIALVQRTGTLVAVMFLDLDRFKNVNDSLGHSIGDKLLQEVARRLKSCVRASDTVSRLGGDEFVVLIADVSDVADVGVTADKVLQAVSRPYSIDGHELVSTPSIGISVYPADGQDVDSLLRNADAAMYHAKESGRNNYQFFTQDMNSRAVERLSLERSLRRALERDELRLHYQPQYDVATGRIVGVEALIRWEHPEHGLVPPSRFMPFAEESGLILPIGDWVLGEACRQNKAWQQTGSTLVRVAVNISALQFRQPNFVETVQRALAAADLEARFLGLEVTESVIMHDAERVTDCLAQLKGMGLELAIDDFGTGYSSLSYLKRFPIDKLKIDKSFVRDINRDRDDAAIVSAIIGLTRSLGLKTIAEGVETPEQHEFLRAYGCDEVQGYLFSTPLPAADCAKLLAEHAPLGLHAA
jgi:diguanylate cyclase (GGDEF)-like protein/PAS domain S-box-containing protein